MKNPKKDYDIFSWAWDQRSKKIPPDEPKYSISEAVDLLHRYSDKEITQKKLRDYERSGVVVPERTGGGHRLYSVSDILSLHLMAQGTKYFGKINTMPIVKLYQFSRKQPSRHNPTVFDFDSALPGHDKVCGILHKPLMESPVRQVTQIIRIVSRIDDFLHINEFARKNGIGFKCTDKELLTVKRAGMSIKIAPPLTEWISVKKAMQWRQFYLAEAKIQDKYPSEKKEFETFEKSINRKIIDWLFKHGYAIKIQG